MTNTSVKFQKDRHKTVGGVAHTRYLLLGEWGGGQNDGIHGRPNTMTPRLSSKRRGTIILTGRKKTIKIHKKISKSYHYYCNEQPGRPRCVDMLATSTEDRPYDKNDT